MDRSYDYHSSSSSSRYYSASSVEYLDCLDRIQRMPSMIADTPYFPKIHEVLNNHPVHVEENYDHHKKKKSDKNKKSDKKNPEGHKKVHFAENGKKTEVNKDKKKKSDKNKKSPEGHKKVHFAENGKKTEVNKRDEEKSIDAEADGFIKQKHRGFELCKV